MVQSNSIAAALEATFGWDRLGVGIVTALLTGIVILGGIGRIGAVSEKLVPCMAALFLGGGLIVLICHARMIPSVLERIVTEALTPRAALGGGSRVWYGVCHALRCGQGSVYQRGRYGDFCHGSCSLQCQRTGGAGNVGDF